MGNYIDANPQNFIDVDLLDPEAISRKLISMPILTTPNKMKTLSKSPAQIQREADAKAEREETKRRKEASRKEAKEKAARELALVLALGKSGGSSVIL